MKYGSAGFNSYGYKAGCAFAAGTFEEAEASPAASRYLCAPEQELQQACLHDFSGNGVCVSNSNWDGFWRVYQVRGRWSPCRPRAGPSKADQPHAARPGPHCFSCRVHAFILVPCAEERCCRSE